MKKSAVDSKVECYLCKGEGVVDPPKMEDHPTDPNVTQSIQEAKTIDDLKKRLEKVIMWYGRFRSEDNQKLLSLSELEQRIDLVSIGRSPKLLPTHNGLRAKLLELLFDKLMEENEDILSKNLMDLSENIVLMWNDAIYEDDLEPPEIEIVMQDRIFKYLKEQMS